MWHILANVLLFVVYLGAGLLLDWHHVRFGHAAFLLQAIGVAFLWTALPVACYVNWRLFNTIKDSDRRLGASILAGVAATALGFPLWCWILVRFHLSVGGYW